MHPIGIQPHAQPLALLQPRALRPGQRQAQPRARHLGQRQGRQRQVAQVARYLGDLSLATLTLTEVPGTRLRLTLAGAQRTGLKQGQRLCVRLDPDWVHVMPTRRP